MTIEEYLDKLCTYELDSLDSKNHIYFSIYKQTQRGIGLTDRQYALVLTKLQEYYDVSDNIPTTNPLRKIDRSKYIKVVDTTEVYSDMVYESYKQKWQWIKIRFPFSKKDIVKIDELKFKFPSEWYYHNKGSHEHYFKLHEKSLPLIIQYFSHFDTDEELIDLNNQITEVSKHKLENTKYYKDETFFNLEKDEVDVIRSDLGNNINNITVYDRRDRYGLSFDNELITDDPLIDKLVNRQSRVVSFDPNEVSLNNIIHSLMQLDRLPILFVLDKTDIDNSMHVCYNAVKDLIDYNKQISLFRVDSTEDPNLNDFMKEKKFNNWLDEKIEIVYISSKSLPKLLLKTNWKPKAIINMSSAKNYNPISVYQKSVCDLNIYYDNFISMYNIRGYRGEYL